MAHRKHLKCGWLCFQDIRMDGNIIRENQREYKYGVLPVTTFCFSLVNSDNKLLIVGMQVVVSNSIVIPAFQKTIKFFNTYSLSSFPAETQIKNKALLKAKALLNCISWHMTKVGIKMKLVCKQICFGSFAG